MSVSTGARKGTPEERRLSDSLIQNEQDLIQRMKPVNIALGGLGPASAGQARSNAPVNDFMEDVNSALQGAISYAQNNLPVAIDQTVHIVRETIDSVYTSFGNLSDAVTDGILDIIDGGDFDGQILKLRIPDIVGSFTINNRNKTGNDTGNIFIAGVDNLIAAGGEVLEFIFDAFTTPPAMAQPSGGIDGVWRLSGGGNSTPEARFGLFELSADQTTGIVVGGRIEFDTDDTTNGGMTTTAGVISGFLAGRVYQINYGFSAEFSVNTAAVTCQITTNGAGDLATTAANSLSVRALIDVSFNPTGTAFFRAAADTDTIQLEFTFVQAVTAILSGITDTNQAGAYLQVTPFQSGGGGGGGGSGGATSLDELSDVTITSPQNNDHLIYNSTAAQWENQVAGVASQTPWLSDIDAAGFSLDNLLALDIEDSGGQTRLNISGPLGVGARFAYLPGDSVFFTSNIVDKVEINDSGLSLLTNDLTMGTGGQIFAGGAAQGMSNIGQLEFINNLATPAATFAIFSDGTDLFANTGSKTVNLDDLPELSANNVWTGTNTFNENIVAGGAGDGMSNIGNLSFVNNLATPITPVSIWSDGAKFLLNANLDLNNNGIEKLTIAQFVDTGGVVRGSISGSAGGEGLLVATGLNELFTIQQVLTPIATFGTIAGDEINFFGDVDLNKNFLFEVGSVVFDAFNTINADGKSITGSSGLMNFTMEDQTDLYRFNFFTGIANVRALEIAQDIIRLREAENDFEIATFQNALGINFNVPLTMNDKAIVSIAQIIQGNDYHERIAMANPGAPDTATKGRVFMDSNNSNHLSIVRQSGLVDLEASAGGSQTPWLSAIDAAGNDLTDFARLEMREGVGLGSSAVSYMVKTSSNWEWNVPTNDGYLFKRVNSNLFGIGNPNNSFVNLSMNSNRITSVADPQVSTDAVPRSYVDSIIEGNQDHEIWVTHETSQFDREVYHCNSKDGSEGASNMMIQNVLYYVPIFLAARTSLVKMAVDVKSSSGTYNLAYGIYSNRTDGQNYPATKLAQATTIFSGTGIKDLAISPAENLERGLYWLAVLTTDSSPPSITNFVPGQCNSVGFMDNLGADFVPIIGYIQVHNSPTLPTTPDDEMVVPTGAITAVYGKFNVNPS